jgi:hypothetical protein
MSGEDYEGWQDSPRGRREPAGYEAEAGYDAESGYSSEPGFEPTVDYNLPRHGRRHAADQYASDQDWDTGAAGYQAQDPYAAPQDPYAAPQPGYRDRDRTGEQDPYGRTDPHGNAGYYPPEPYDSRGDYGGQPSPHADNGYQQNGYGQGEFAQGNLAPGYDNRDSYPSQAGYQGQDPYDGRGFYNGQAGGGEPEAFGGQRRVRPRPGRAGRIRAALRQLRGGVRLWSDARLHRRRRVQPGLCQPAGLADARRGLRAPGTPGIRLSAGRCRP